MRCMFIPIPLLSYLDRTAEISRIRYKDQAAVDRHLSTSYLAELLDTEKKEGLKRAEDIYYLLEGAAVFIRDSVETE